MEAQAVRVSLQLKPDLRIVLYDGAKEWYKSVIRFETQDICASDEYYSTTAHSRAVADQGSGRGVRDTVQARHNAA